MTRDKQLEIAVQALRDIAFPMAYYKRRADAAGLVLDGNVLALINDPQVARNAAVEALRKMGRKP